MPYLPAKDELVSLNRLSSRWLWKWYNSKVLDRRLYGVGQHFTFCRFSRKRKFFGNFDCDFRKCFTKGFFLTEYEEFRNFRFDGKFSIFTDSRSYKLFKANKSLKTQDFYRHFNTCPREWKLLSLYMYRRIIFPLLIVSSLSCNFNRCAVCFQSFSGHRFQEYSKYRAYQTLLKITHR